MRNKVTTNIPTIILFFNLYVKKEPNYRAEQKESNYRTEQKESN